MMLLAGVLQVLLQGLGLSEGRAVVLASLVMPFCEDRGTSFTPLERR